MEEGGMEEGTKGTKGVDKKTWRHLSPLTL
jgi:hypothetical protein